MMFTPDAYWQAFGETRHLDYGYSPQAVQLGSLTPTTELLETIIEPAFQHTLRPWNVEGD